MLVLSLVLLLVLMLVQALALALAPGRLVETTEVVLLSLPL
jgi:hypothetical protein